MTELPVPDPNSAEAVEYAAALIARSNLVRLNPGELVTVRPGRFSRYGMAYSVVRLNPEERDWLATYQAAARVKRREDREQARTERRTRP